MSARWFFAFILALNLLLFQNCSSPDASFNPGQSNSAKLPSTIASDSNGQPYDGKIYVLHGDLCADGTDVQSRIILNTLQTASVVRENCVNIAPIVLRSSEFSINPSNGDQLFYRQKTYIADVAPLSLAKITSWTYQLAGTLQRPDAEIYDIDMFGTSAATIAALKAEGRTVICYIPAGHFETDRPDSSQFNPADVGNRLFTGSPDRWLDTRSASVRSLIIARLDLAKSKGCDGVDFDSVDAYTSNSGFPLTAATQIDFNLFLAYAAHDRNMLVALNNVPDIAKDLVHAFDFAVTQQCYEDGDCDKYKVFTDLGKPVLSAEYTSYSAAQCDAAKASSISLTYFSANLDGTRREVCPL